MYGYYDRDDPPNNAHDNTVTIDGGSVNQVSGGSSAYGNAFKNTVTVDSGTVSQELIGGQGREAWQNTVKINDGHIGGEHFRGIYGGRGDPAYENTVSIFGGTVTTSSISGGAGSNAYKNTVSISSEAKVYANQIYGSDSWSNATEYNTVSISGGEVYTDQIFGGYASGDATSNVVTISGGTIQAPTPAGGETALPIKIYGGFSSGGGSATNNTIRLEGNPVIQEVTFYGGYSYSSGSGDVRTGNTLEVHTTGLTAVNVKNFEYYHFYLPDTVQANATVLTLTSSEGTDISNSKVGVAVSGKATPLQAGDTVTLLINEHRLTAANIQQESLKGRQGVTLDYEFSLSTTNTSLVATVTKAPTQNPQTKALPEGLLGGTTALLQGSDLVAGKGLDAARHATAPLDDPRVTFGTFAAVSTGWSRYNTGSHVDVSSFSLVTGLALGTGWDLGRLTLGAFFEYGTGSSSTYNSFSNAPSVNGDGTIWYMGGGLLARMDFADTGPGHFYLEASGRAGGMHNDYENGDMRDASGRMAEYSTYVPYYSIHGGLGYIWNLSDTATLDLYGKYFWTHQSQVDTHLSTGEAVEFEDVNSYRLRFGSRFSCSLNDYLAPYVGVAWEHEFDGRARTRINGYSTAEPTLEGDTGIGELGFVLTPSQTLPLSIDLGVQGYTGVREGVTGSVLVKLEF